MEARRFSACVSYARPCAVPGHCKKPIKIGITLPAVVVPRLPLQCSERRRFWRNPLICGPILDQTCSKPWGKLRLFTSSERRKGSLNGPDRQIVNFGGTQMLYRHGAIAAAALSLAVLAPTGFASAADLPVKAAKAPPPDLPFFFVIDDRVTYSYIFSGTDPGVFSRRHHHHGRFRGLRRRNRNLRAVPQHIRLE